MTTIEVQSNTVAGFYKLEAFREDADGNEIPGSRRVAADWFPNLITDVGLEAMGTVSVPTLTSWCRVGSGTTAPAFTDTGLVAQVAATSTQQALNSGAQAAAPYYGFYTITRRFAAGAAAGNLSEVGMADASTGGTLFSRALILDGAGNPTTITVLADEVLDVTYQLRNYPPLTDGTWGATIGGVDYTGTVRASDVTSSVLSPNSSSAAGGDNGVSTITVYNGTIGAITESPSGTNSTVDSSNAAYAANSKVRDFSGTFDLNAGNVTGGITAIRIRTTYGYYQMSVSPAIPKDNTKTLSLTFRCGPWGRYTP